MKNFKGQVSIFLTLGLVIVGTLITLGTSLFVNNKNTNLASNTRAALAEPYCPSSGDSSCWIVKCLNGKPGKLQYTASLCNSSMPKTSCQGNSPYGGGGTMIIGIAASDAKVKTFECAAGTNDEVPPGGDIPKDPDIEPDDISSCTDITCEKTLVKGTTPDELSFNESGFYYEGSGCEDAEIGYVGAAQSWCAEKSATGCSIVTCKIALNYDLKAQSENIRQKQIGGAIRYYSLDDKSCANAIDPKTVCLPPEELPKCEKINCQEMGLGDDAYDKEIYYSKEGIEGYFTSCTTTTPVDQATIDSKCLPEAPIPPGINNPTGKTIESDGVEHYFCVYKTFTSAFNKDLLTYYQKCEEFYGDDFVIGEQGSYTYCCQK